MELKYDLLGYGIPDLLPFDDDGYLIYDNFEDQVSKQIAVEKATMENQLRDKKLVTCKGTKNNAVTTLKEIIESPTELDVLMGRGKPYQDFPGTVHLRELIQEYRPKYDISRKREKTKIVMDIIRSIRNSGGRFLKKEVHDDDDEHEGKSKGGRGGGGFVWVEADTESAHRKVSNAFTVRGQRMV